MSCSRRGDISLTRPGSGVAVAKMDVAGDNTDGHGGTSFCREPPRPLPPPLPSRAAAGGSYGRHDWSGTPSRPGDPVVSTRGRTFSDRLGSAAESSPSANVLLRAARRTGHPSPTMNRHLDRYDSQAGGDALPTTKSGRSCPCVPPSNGQLGVSKDGEMPGASRGGKVIDVPAQVQTLALRGASRQRPGLPDPRGWAGWQVGLAGTLGLLRFDRAAMGSGTGD